MAGFPATAWIWWTAGVVVGLLAVWLLYRSLLYDRSRGRRRCPKCWYDMSGTDSLTCSECGGTFKRERKLHKTRRRWRWVFLAMLALLTAHVLHTTPRMQRAGWIGVVPTTCLIGAFPWRHKLRWLPDLAYQPGADSIVANELSRRVVGGEPWNWQRRWLVSLCLRGLRSPQVPWDGEGSASQVFSMWDDLGSFRFTAAPQLIEYLRSSNTRQVLQAIHLLPPSDRNDILTALRGALHHEDATVRAAAVNTARDFVTVAPNLVREAISEALQDDDPRVREAGVWLARDFGSASPVFVRAAITTALQDEHPQVIVSAIVGVGFDFPDRGFEPAIEELLEHENANVRSVARWALEGIAAQQGNKRAPANGPSSSNP